jgi:hypothetical protein
MKKSNTETSVKLNMSPEELFGSHSHEYTKQERYHRWKTILKLESEANINKWSTLNNKNLSYETCFNCVHRENNWCNDIGLPCNFNPIVKDLGMACSGLGHEPF